MAVRRGKSPLWNRDASGAGICEYRLIWKKWDGVEDGPLVLTLNAVAQIANK